MSMNNKSIGPFSRTLFTKDIIDRLRMDIILGNFPPRSRLVELQLAADLGVSRGPIRTALQVLEQEGLVESLPNGGTRVVGFTMKNASDMFDFRFLLEHNALSQILNNPLANFHPLLDVIDILQDFYAKSKIENLTKTITAVDIQYHRSIMVMAENKITLQAWNTMANVLYTILEISNTTYEEFSQYYIRHKKLADLIISRNPEAIAELEEHIMHTKDIILKRLEKVISS